MKFIFIDIVVQFPAKKKKEEKKFPLFYYEKYRIFGP